MLKRIAALVPLLLMIAACGSDDGGGAGQDGGASDAGGDPPPIAERASQGTYHCSLQRDRTDHSPRSWGSSLQAPALVKTSGGTAFLARVESTAAIPTMPGTPQFTLSTFDVAGTFGPPIALPASMPSDIGGLAAAPRADGFALVWIEGSRLRFAAFDGAGQTIVAAKDIVADVDPLTDPRLAPGSDGGFGLIFAPTVSATSREVRFAVLDAAGTVRVAPRPLSTGIGSPFMEPATTITATAGGYALLWRDPSSATGGVDFATADLNGVEQIARTRVSVTSDPHVVVGGASLFDPATTSLLAVGDGYLAAWTEVTSTHVGADVSDPASLSGAWSTVMVARLDRAGQRLTPPTPMRAPTDSIDEVEPALIPFGDAVAVQWGRGQHIYICGGCVPDTRMDLLLIDPTTLTPLGDVISVSNGGTKTGGGLLNRRAVVVGDTLLTTYLLTFHTYASPGSAAFTCTR